MNRVLRSRRVCCNGTIKSADVILDHDYIREVAPYKSEEEATDFGNLLISPGFIDLHSDSIEKEVEPRPGAQFPVRSALVELDKKLAMAGITTMYHAICFNDESMVGQRGTRTAATLINAVWECNTRLLSIDNLVHARYEITSFDSIETIKQLVDKGRIQLLSIMDHSPGQGQFRSIEKWKRFHVPAYKLTEDKALKIIHTQQEKKKRSHRYLEDLMLYAREHNILLASHDDDSCDKIELLHDMGVSIAEFPLNKETAAHAQNKGMATGMGAPNVVRGKSQSGNISARELLALGNCDFICSDYHPTSMLQAVYTMHQEMEVPLAGALACITSTPARVSKMEDRGEIAPGKLADLAIIDDQEVAKVVMTLKSGIPVYNSNSCFCMKAA